jgi:serine/threonine protein kinase
MPRPRAHLKGYTREAGAEPIPGYRLLAPLGRGAYGEVWKCRAPGGLEKALKIVGATHEVHESLDGANPLARQELQALERIKAIRHPFLLSMERLELVAGELLIVMELADKSLHDILTECQAAGLPGVPRAQLLPLLCEAAEALDLLNVEHGLQHLDVKPHNLFVVSNHIKVADFGLVQSLRDLQGGDGAAEGQPIGTPYYASPEAAQGRISRYSDQYSLAIVYQELLTGTFPIRGKSAMQLARQHLLAEPDLGPLPESEQPVVARALAKAPEERFPGCVAFVHALAAAQAPARRWRGVKSVSELSVTPRHEAGGSAPPAGGRTGPSGSTAVPLLSTPSPAVETADGLALVVPAADLLGDETFAAEAVPPRAEVLEGALWARLGAVKILEHANFRYLELADGVLEHHCPIRGVPALVRLKLDGFRQACEAELLRQNDLDYLFRIEDPPSLWQRCTGQRTGLELRIQLHPGEGGPGSCCAVTARIKALGRSLTARSLPRVGPVLFETLRAYLLPLLEQRSHERFPYPYPLSVYPVLPDLEIADEVEAVGQDISLTGIRFRVPDLPDCGHLYLRFDRTPEAFAVLAHIVRVEPCPEGGLDVAASFLNTDGPCG